MDLATLGLFFTHDDGEILSMKKLATWVYFVYIRAGRSLVCRHVNFTAYSLWNNTVCRLLQQGSLTPAPLKRRPFYAKKQCETRGLLCCWLSITEYEMYKTPNNWRGRWHSNNSLQPKLGDNSMTSSLLCQWHCPANNLPLPVRLQFCCKADNCKLWRNANRLYNYDWEADDRLITVIGMFCSQPPACTQAATA